jgi:hypothetical protein
LNSYNKTNTYGDLRAVVLGSYYTPEYFKFIDNASVRNPLMRIATEVNEDLTNFEQILTRQGIKVLRPALPSIEKFVDYHSKHNKFLIPPLQPRNFHAVIGQTMYTLSQPNFESTVFTNIDQCIKSYNPTVINLNDSNQQFYSQSMTKKQNCFNSVTNLWYKENKYNELAGPDWPPFDEYVQGNRSNILAIQEELVGFETALCYETKELGPLQAPNLLPFEDQIVVDCNEFCLYDQWVQKNIGNKQIIKINTGAAHTDGVLSILGNRVILGIDTLIDYKKYFPEYTLIPVPNENYLSHIDNFRIMQSKVDGKWWVPGEEHNENFINYVEQYLNDWTGHIHETVFDVNVLPLDRTTICITGDNPAIINELAQHGIESIVVPWRHRFFVDGGLHCITLDLYREN